jgi:hypothetical protein
MPPTAAFSINRSTRKITRLIFDIKQFDLQDHPPDLRYRTA